MKQILDLYLDKFDIMCLIKGIQPNQNTDNFFINNCGRRRHDGLWEWNHFKLEKQTIENLYNMYCYIKKENNEL